MYQCLEEFWDSQSLSSFQKAPRCLSAGSPITPTPAVAQGLAPSTLAMTLPTGASLHFSSNVTSLMNCPPRTRVFSCSPHASRAQLQLGIQRWHQQGKTQPWPSNSAINSKNIMETKGGVFITIAFGITRQCCTVAFRVRGTEAFQQQLPVFAHTGRW